MKSGSWTHFVHPDSRSGRGYGGYRRSDARHDSRLLLPLDVASAATSGLVTSIDPQLGSPRMVRGTAAGNSPADSGSSYHYVPGFQAVEKCPRGPPKRRGSSSMDSKLLHRRRRGRRRECLPRTRIRSSLRSLPQKRQTPSLRLRRSARAGLQPPMPREGIGPDAAFRATHRTR